MEISFKIAVIIYLIFLSFAYMEISFKHKKEMQNHIESTSDLKNFVIEYTKQISKKFGEK